MKKILLSAAAIFAAMSMNAQEFCSFNPDNALNLDTENGTALTAGTVIGETTSIVATVGADDTFKPQSATFIANGEPISGGLQGGTNPKDADGGTPATTLLQPASGAFLVFEAKADGFLYVMHKASSNKAYSVFEEGTAISYTFAAIGDAATDLGAVYQFTLPYEVENEQYVVKNPIEWAEQEFLKNTAPDKYTAHTSTDAEGKTTWDAIKVNGLGVIKFPVYKDCKYIVNANGSKITAAGFAFSTEDNILIQSSDEAVIYKGEGAAEPVSKVYSVIGTLNGNWDVDTDMVLVNGVYSATFENVAEGSYEYKIRQDHDWAINWGDNGDGTGVQDGPNFKAELPAGASITITFDPATAAINAYVAGGVLPPDGNTVLWDTETAFDSWSATIVIEAEKFANIKAGDIIRVSYKDKGGDFNPIYKHVEDWSDWTDFQNAINKDNEGYFEAPVTEDAIAELQSKGLRFQGVGFVLTKVELISDASAINSVKAAKKFEGAIFNVAGQKVNASYKGLVIKDGKKYIQK